MKKIFNILILLFVLEGAAQAQTLVCCPEFKLEQDYKPPASCTGNCPNDVNGSPAGGTGVAMMASCRTTHTYTVVPNLIASGYTYTWSVIGGTPTSATGNPINITWAAASTNVQITVVISGPNGCNKTIKQNICLVDGPIANIITAAPNPVCAGTPVNFSAANTSTMFYDWDFGDGTYATGQNVTHTYAYSPSIPCYNAILTVRGDTSKRRCGCFDRDTVQVCVNNGTGLQITPASCKKMFCPGDTATFCATNCSGPYTWTVVGGTPATFTGNCIQVTWNASSLVPASVTVTSANCPAGCGGSATLQVPVLFPNLQINGATTVCPGSTTNYSLPNLPGTFYSWSLSGGGIIAAADSNTSNIVINWNSFPVPGGPYTLICNYNNPITGCSGTHTTTILVKPPFTIMAFTIPCVGNTFNYFNNAITGDPVAWTITPAHPPFPLTAPAVTGTWATPNTYTILATPVTTANYCTSSATVVVTVNPKPVITGITPSTPVCKGSTQVYAALSTLPNTGTFTWNVTGAMGGTFVTLGAHNDSIQVSWDPAAPSYSITVSQFANGCNSAPFTQTINTVANPTILPATATACIDAITNFTASGGTSYTWSINNSLGSLASPQGSNPMNVQWNGSATPGTSTSIVTVANQCGNTASATINIITPNLFIVTQSGDLCNPTGVLLTTSGGVSGFVWTGPAVSGTGSSVNALAPGLYTVTALGTGGCPVKATITVIPKYLPAITITSGASKLWYCPGDPINVVLTPSFSSSYTGCTYQWYKNGVSMGAGYTSPTLTITSAGVLSPGVNSFYIIVKCGGCTSQSNAISVTLLSSCILTGDCPYSSAKLAGGAGASTLTTTPFGSVSITSPSTGTTLCGGTGTFTSTYSISPGSIAVASAFWSFGDGTIAPGTQTGSGFGPYNNTVTHSYTHCGNYQVIMYVDVQCGTAPNTYCLMSDTINVVVPAVAKFNPTVVCNKVYLQDMSSVCNNSVCNFSYAWSATGPGTVSFSPASTGLYSAISNTTVMTASVSGTYTITLTLSSAACGCIGATAVVYSQVVTINLPTATIASMPPVCAGMPVGFSGSGAGVGGSYQWNFYSTYQSNLANPIHTFPAPPPSTQPVTLNITDANGCTANTIVNIIVRDSLKVNITGTLNICPGDNTILTATTNTISSPCVVAYQWYYNGIMVGTNSTTYTATLPGQYWVTASTTGCNCFAVSPKVTVKLKQAPIANIVPVTRICLGGGGGAPNLQNSINQLNTIYTWSVLSPPTTVTFTPNGTNAAWFTTVTPASPVAGDYIFVLEAMNTISGCKARDTICIKVYNSPTFTVSGGPGCEGVNNVFTALPAVINNYLWSNGATGNIMTTSIAGLYNVTATNPISGCSTTQYGVALVKPKPNVSLFPLSGCDTLCSKDTLVPPLPLLAGQTYGTTYVIKWYDGVTLIHTGPFLPLNILIPIPGQHNIHIVVTFIGNTCASTSGDYKVYVKNCAVCDCKESHWGEINLTEGQKAAAKNNVKANVPVPIILKCNSGQKLDCNKTYTIDASYICKDTACGKKVTYTLIPGVGSPISGTMPLTFTTPGINTVYVLKIYGWCGDKICDSCDIDLIIECNTVNCCEGSVWEESPWYAFDNGAKKKINCSEKEQQVINISGDICKQKLTFGATIKCPPNCKSADSVLVYDIANNLVQSGPAPLTLNTLADGTYTVEIIGYCGGVACLKCKITIKIKCGKKCECDEKEPILLTVTGNDKIKQIRCGMDLGKLDCNSSLTIAGTYTCNPKDCPSSLTYVMTGPGGPVSGTLPLTINTGTLTNGTYTILIQAYCNGKLCKECKISFTVECEKLCCPYKNITATTGTIKYDYTQIPNATLAAQTFTINGLALASITEVRANVLTYTIDDNYKKECMKCVNLPFTWASIASAANIGAVPGLITMYGGTTVASFNGSGAGAYQNPREVIWNNGTPVTIPNGTNIGINFILPAVPVIDCCELKGKICVKFSFRDKDCKECEVIACFDFVIKKK